ATSREASSDERATVMGSPAPSTRVPLPGPARPPAVRAAPRARGLPRGGLALRGDHRDLRAAAVGLRAAARRGGPLPRRPLGQPAARRHARRFAAPHALPAPPRPPVHAARERRPLPR